MDTSTPQSEISLGISVSPFIFDPKDVEGSATKFSADFGTGASFGLDISVPFEEDETGKKKYNPSGISLGVNYGLLDLNPIGSLSVYDTETSTSGTSSSNQNSRNNNRRYLKVGESYTSKNTYGGQRVTITRTK